MIFVGLQFSGVLGELVEHWVAASWGDLQRRASVLSQFSVLRWEVRRWACRWGGCWI